MRVDKELIKFICKFFCSLLITLLILDPFDTFEFIFNPETSGLITRTEHRQRVD
jgi:hypothetical protein